jgi:hypothetical protein
MSKNITLDSDTVELLVRHARAGLISMQENLDSPITEELDRNARITLQSEVHRGHRAIYEAERELFHLVMNSNTTEIRRPKVNKEGNKSFDFSSSKTDWIEGKR